MVDRKTAVEAFARAVQGPEARLDLFDAALCIAGPEYPALDGRHYRALLDTWARRARAVVGGTGATRETPAVLAAVCHVLFREVGLKGNLDHYSDPRNSFLNDVMDRHLGLPITLSIVFVEVARRAGLDAHGVAFPGHFLARVEDPDDEGTFVVVDSFSGGNILGLQNLGDLLSDAVGSPSTLTPSMLGPASTHSVLIRMLRNLKAAYAEAHDLERALLAQERILTLLPREPAEVRDHGMLLFHTGEMEAAGAELEHYLSLAPTAEDVREVEAALQKSRRQKWNIQ